MVFRREGTYGLVALLVTLVVAATLLVYPAWSQEGERKTERQTEKKVEKKNETRKQKSTWTESNSTRNRGLPTAKVAEIENAIIQQEQQAAQSDGSGDLVGNDVDVEPTDDPIEFIEIFGEDCQVDDEAFIVFEVVDNDSPDDGRFGIVSQNENVEIDEDNGSITVEDATNPGSPIQFFTLDEDSPDELEGNLEVVASGGIDCDDNNGNNGNDDDDDRRERRDERFRERVNEVLEEEGLIDEDGDGDIDEEDEFLDAQDDLDGETTDGELTDADTLDDDGPGVSATADGDGAEASTPGAVASAGGDPDEQAPVTDPLGDVEDEIPTSGPLPNTGGMPLFYWLLPLAGLLLLAGLPVYRWANRRE